MTSQERAKAKIDYLISHPEELLKKKPFTRGSSQYTVSDMFREQDEVKVGERETASLPRFSKKKVTQDQFVAELDPASHKIHFDENVPKITAKTQSGGYVDIEFITMGVPYQKRIRDKQVLYLCGNGVQFTLNNDSPTEQQAKDFALLKRRWKSRNMNGRRTQMVSAQKSYGEGGLLFYFDRHGRLKAKLISYEDGYVIISHNDDNGDRLLEVIYYANERGVPCMDVFSDTNQWRYTLEPSKDNKPSWKIDEAINGVPHYFPEIPLVTKRGPVAWNDVQDEIEVYEIIYNIFLVIQKRHGWGVLYIKGNFSEKGKKLAGNIILTDNSYDANGDAKFLTPPTPEGMLDTLKLIDETIQKGSGCTFILPKDISTGADVSGVAIQITQSLDNEEALSGVIEWQNAVDKMERLFSFGIAKEEAELHNDIEAQGRFSQLDISVTFKRWMPRSDHEYNQMLCEMKSQGIISRQTAIENNTESSPDEDLRIRREAEEALEQEKRAQGTADTE